NVILAVDFLSFDEGQSKQLAEMSRATPLVFAGVPKVGGTLAKLLGAGSATLDEEPKLRRLKFSAHPIMRDIQQRELRMKYVPALFTGNAKPHAPWKQIGEISLWDNQRMGPGLVVHAGKPRKVFFPFNLGKVFAFHCCNHPNLRQDLDVFAPTPHATVDILRTLLRNAILWANPKCIMARPYYWPVRNGKLPQGVLLTSHDLCGFSPEGLAFIKKTCREAGTVTTFFDYPPFRLKRGDPGPHDVALHVPVATSLDVIRKRKRELEKLHGREFRGWRRHGASLQKCIPSIWHKMAKVGVQWCADMAVQSHPWMVESEGMATTNRLPYRLFDANRGTLIGLLEIPAFDSGDCERLTNIHYGRRVDWKTFVANVEGKLDFVRRHNLCTDYLIHGWTAGVQKEAAHTYGAKDCQRMLKLIIKMAKQRGFAVMGHEEIYDWWTLREQVEVTAGDDGIEVSMPQTEEQVAIEFLSFGPLPERISVGGRSVRLKPWPQRQSAVLVLTESETENP
ncbi:MAG: hypothetical protein QF662_04350, partial [Phycisphaerae bacterium]|nr:hypothetical protein [Phycisphaerae bacterium]